MRRKSACGWTLGRQPAYTGWMWMVVVGLFMVAARAASAGPILESIEIGEHPAAVRLRVSGPVETRARTLAAEGSAPERVYLDLPDTALAGAVPRLTGGSGPLLRVRAGQFDATTTRVVLDLADAVPFTIEQAGGTITITLSPAPPAPSAPPATQPAPLAAAPASPPPSPAPPAAVPTTPPPSAAPLAAARTSPPTSAAPPAAVPTSASAPTAASTSPPPAPAPLAALPASPPPPRTMPSATAEPAPAPAPKAPPQRRPASLRVASLPEHPLIVLDAGHGGRDPGAEGVGGVIEKDVVLELAQLVAKRLTARLPVDVLMTRIDDSFVPIQRRLAVSGAGATLFISLHANSCSDPSARGLEIFYGGGTVRTATSGGADPRAALFGRCLDEALQARIGGVRGAPRAGTYGVLVRNPVPSALVEIGYLTHPGEAAQTQDRDYQDLLADALTDGVAAFLRASAPRL